MRFSHAIARTPGATFADGLTTAGLGRPDLERALAQHGAYVEALRRCGLEVLVLPPDEAYPDSTFVEDTAIVSPTWALVTRPGAASRAGETEAVREVLRQTIGLLGAIEAPGTLDGGDVCEAGERFFIGVSGRTNEAGAAQLAVFLEGRGRPSTIVDIREIPGLLHLKSGVCAVDTGTLVVTESLAGHPALSGYRMLVTAPEEAYAANCVRVNDRVLVAAGFPKLEEALRREGLTPLPLEMSEFRKMDGGLSCLSLRR